MSLSTLATEELERTEKRKQTVSKQQELKKELVVLAPSVSMSVVKKKWSTGFASLTNYIPTEAITLYVAACSAMLALKETFSWVTEARVYWFFVGFTPVLFLLVFFSQRRQSGLSFFPPLEQWPWWKLTSSTVAFSVWALALPTTPYFHSPTAGALAGFGALSVSTFLTVLEPIFERKTK